MAPSLSLDGSEASATLELRRNPSPAVFDLGSWFAKRLSVCSRLAIRSTAFPHSGAGPTQFRRAYVDWSVSDRSYRCLRRRLVADLRRLGLQIIQRAAWFRLGGCFDLQRELPVYWVNALGG